jgi:transposase InsO family protein
MSHSNALLSPRGRLHMAKIRVEDGNTIRETARRCNVSTTTVIRWSKRYAEVVAEGREPTPADMVDRSSRPHRCPRATKAKLVKKVIRKRCKKRIGPLELGRRTGLAPSTVHRILVEHRMNRLQYMDRATGAVLRYERKVPGELIHLDIKKIAVIPEGGHTWRTPTGQRLGAPRRNRAKWAKAERATKNQCSHHYVHNALDDHSRVVYSEIHDNEKGATAAEFWLRAKAYYESLGMTIQEVLTDNGPCYRSNLFRDALANGNIKHRRTRPYRPQTNGKIERFHRTLAHGWVYSQVWNSEADREAGLQPFIDYYNRYRPHTGIGGKPPLSRVTNLPG